MSNIYIQEPPTSGKVLLQTSVGDIDIELWSKEAPKAARNFIQLCLEGYYDNTIFHRVVKGFIAQCGDPSGTGHGGDSIYGKPFRDEFHSRLKFNHRGLVAMANAGRDDNASQFFFTLGATPELDKKHTIFGKVAGQTVYNMLKLEDVEIGADDRPAYPPTINRTKVLYNPFEDIVPRTQSKRRKDGDETKRRKNKSRATKNFNLLSFGEEAEEDEEEVNKVSNDMRTKTKSSHDILPDSSLSTLPAKSSPQGATSTDRSSSRSPMKHGDKRSHSESSSDAEQPSEDEETKAEKAATLERIRKKLKKDDQAVTPTGGGQLATDNQNKQDKVTEDSLTAGTRTSLDHSTERDQSLSKVEQLRREAKQLKKELQGTKKELDTEVYNIKTKSPPQNDVIAAYEEERKKYEDRKISKKKSSRENETLSILAKFQSRLSAARSMTAYTDDVEEEDKQEEEDDEEEEEDPNDMSWMNHKLRFESNRKKVIDANVQDADRYEIFDPRNPLNQRRREASKQALKDKR